MTEAPTKVDETDPRVAAGRDTVAMLTGLFEAARLIPAASADILATMPLTIISGFLGAGKTTLVNRLLTQPHGRRIAVLVNDFGAVNIDEELIRSRNADTIGLTNGCACCTVAGDLTKALMKLIAQPDPPDAIVLEASGLADPHGIIQIALANPALRLDGVLTLVDGETLLERLHDPQSRPTIEGQIRAADVIVLNKTDMLDSQGATRSRLTGLADARPVVETRHADLPVDLVLGIGSKRSKFQCFVEGHAAAFRSRDFAWDGVLDRATVEATLARLPANVVRAKGVFRLHDRCGGAVYQRVGRRGGFDMTPVPAPEQSRLVVIGTAETWDEAAIDETLASLTSRRDAI